MEVNIVGPKIYYEIPIDVPLLGRPQISETFGSQLDCHAYNYFVCASF